MQTVAGILGARGDAEAAVARLRELGLAENNISLLMPGTTPEQLDERVPTTETEQPGMGKALGGTVGGAIGIAGGLHLGLALSDRKSTRLNSSHVSISYAVFCLKKKKK